MRKHGKCLIPVCPPPILVADENVKNITDDAADFNIMVDSTDYTFTALIFGAMIILCVFGLVGYLLYRRRLKRVSLAYMDFGIDIEMGTQENEDDSDDYDLTTDELNTDNNTVMVENAEDSEREETENVAVARENSTEGIEDSTEGEDEDNEGTDEIQHDVTARDLNQLVSGLASCL